jgi:hypothetical protein
MVWVIKNIFATFEKKYIIDFYWKGTMGWSSCYDFFFFFSKENLLPCRMTIYWGTMLLVYSCCTSEWVSEWVREGVSECLLVHSGPLCSREMKPPPPLWCSLQKQPPLVRTCGVCLYLSYKAIQALSTTNVYSNPTLYSCVLNTRIYLLPSLYMCNLLAGNHMQLLDAAYENRCIPLLHRPHSVFSSLRKQ